MEKYPIGIFDSGYGGLTVMKEVIKLLPQYDYIYLGDNARAPYGPRSFDTVYKYTLESVKWLFNKGCRIVILACNTASAKALRTIQQNDLPLLAPDRRVLGVIRPVTESVGEYTKTNVIGVLGTVGTIRSESYIIEINKFFPDITVVQEACPMWVPLVENNEFSSDGADYFVRKNILNILSINPNIDTLILGCTHYPILFEKIRKHTPQNIAIVSQGQIVAAKFADYLKRHPEFEIHCSKNKLYKYYTTDSPTLFNQSAEILMGERIFSEHAVI